MLNPARSHAVFLVVGLRPKEMEEKRGGGQMMHKLPLPHPWTSSPCP